ncbi:hypothetical protein VIGAN_03041400 [Vigna angularis var. angularis]|uniref:Uncharacterized protein n=1 Tax=Vigna angularis var. angularis TaxID=157739 RepID=A0A0S3RJI8_PHAAN|nr:hypothetical protein VIGAN_03041400 [Vigna angularis var. angularis]
MNKIQTTFLVQSNDIFVVWILEPEQLIAIVLLCHLLFKLLNGKLDTILTASSVRCTTSSCFFPSLFLFYLINTLLQNCE